jgi:hypothetical protein
VTRVVLAACGVAAMALLAACGPTSISSTELMARISRQIASGPGATDDYHLPSATRADAIASAVASTARGRRQVPPGYGAVAVGAGDGEAILLAEEDPVTGQGTYVVRPNAPTAVLIEVPHPRADSGTEKIGEAWFSRGQALSLLVAGAHRRAGKGLADVTHSPGTTFDRVSAVLGARGTTIVQLHGFDATAHDSSADVILSSAATSPTPQLLQIAESLTRNGFRVCVYGRDSCPLGAMTNLQASAARRSGASFVHVEMSAPTRADASRSARLIDALAAVLTPDT